MKKTAVWILTLTLALLMCACSSAKEDPNLGVYTGQSGAMGSLSVPVDAAFPGGFSLELKSDGRAALTVNGDEYNVKWSAEGDRLKVEAADTVMSGTIGSGTIVLENVLGSGVETCPCVWLFVDPYDIIYYVLLYSSGGKMPRICAKCRNLRNRDSGCACCSWPLSRR